MQKWIIKIHRLEGRSKILSFFLYLSLLFHLLFIITVSELRALSLIIVL